tara:strand:- start:357 stop:764 length:408 start_codon:yes stop_codon:yes gene_type:complete
MKLHHTQYKKNYQNFILETISTEECLSYWSCEKNDRLTREVFHGYEREAKVYYIFDRFFYEMDFQIKRSGKLVAMTEWLQGLALNIPHWNDDIIPLAKKMGSINDNLTPKQEQKIIDNYWSFMANIVLGLEKEYH